MSGLDQEFEGKVVAANVDATTPEAAAVCKELGFGNHGIVIRSADGDRWVLDAKCEHCGRG